MKTGDPVTITYEGKTVPGVVQLASRNGRSLMLMFEAMLGGFMGLMPVLDHHGTGDYVDLMFGKPVKIEPATRCYSGSCK